MKEDSFPLTFADKMDKTAIFSKHIPQWWHKFSLESFLLAQGMLENNTQLNWCNFFFWFLKILTRPDLIRPEGVSIMHLSILVPPPRTGWGGARWCRWGSFDYSQNLMPPGTWFHCQIPTLTIGMNRGFDLLALLDESMPKVKWPTPRAYFWGQMLPYQSPPLPV